MFKTKHIEKIVELTLVSGFIKDDVPISLMLIAGPESAKTSILLGFECAKTLETIDLSPAAITKDIIPKLKDDEIYHILVPDFVKVLAHKIHTVDATVAFLNAMMEEGVKNQTFFGQTFSLPERKTCGLITSVTTDFFYTMFKKWNDIGFTTRFLPISYTYSFETVAEIHNLIRKNVFFKDIVKVNIKRKKKYSVPIPDDIASFLSVEAQRIAEHESGHTITIYVQGGKPQKVPVNIYGFRLQRQFRQLVRALALLRDGRKPAVNWQDAEEFKKLMDYIRMPQNPKEI